MGENPAVGSANGRMQRLGHGQPGLAGRPRPGHDRERHLLEGRPGDRDRGDAHRGHRHRGVLPAGRRAHREGRHLHQYPADAAVAPSRRSSRPGTRAASCGSSTTSAAGSGRSWPPLQADEMDRPVLDLTWDYPVEGPLAEPSAEAVLPRSTAGTRNGKPLSSYTQLKDDGSTACGCWIYCGVYADGVNQAARRKPGARAELGRPGVGLGVAGQPADPVQPRLRRPRRQAVERAQGLRLVGRGGGPVDRARRAGLRRRPAAVLPARRRMPPAWTRSPASTRSSCRPTARAGCSRRPAWWTARCPRTTSRRSPRSPTCSTASSATRSGRSSGTGRTRSSPAGASRAPRCSRTWSPPTGSPSITPRAG